MARIVVTVVAVVVIAAAVGLFFMYSGIYNISAMEEHNSLTLWAVETMKDNSIERHAGEIDAPALADSAMIAEGFDHFDHSCVECHGAPGIGRDEFANGLYPEAPSLSDEIHEWDAAELFWITKHGIKMTGMPAFGDTHNDEEIWKMVAFLQTLPDLGYYEYLDMRKTGEKKMEDSHDHEH